LTERLRVEVTRTAARQIREAAAWWEANRPAAPGAVAEDLERAFQLLGSQPLVGARAINARLSGVRRIHLPRIRYHLYYRVRASSVQVMAVWHSSRSASPEV
jgi:plasmid stabilization system protein ParE